MGNTFSTTTTTSTTTTNSTTTSTTTSTIFKKNFCPLFDSNDMFQILLLFSDSETLKKLKALTEDHSLWKNKEFGHSLIKRDFGPVSFKDQCPFLVYDGLLDFQVSADFSQPEINAKNCSISKRNVSYNDYYKHSHRFLYSGNSNLQLNFDLRIIFNLKIKMTHLSSAGSGGYHSYVDITINGNDIKKHYSPPSYGYINETFYIDSNLLNQGKNELKIVFLKDARTHYWLQKIIFAPALVGEEE